MYRTRLQLLLDVWRSMILRMMAFVSWLIDKFRRRVVVPEQDFVLVEEDPPEWAPPFADSDVPPPSGDGYGLPPASITHPVVHVPNNVSTTDGAVECSICLEDDSGNGCNEYKLPCGHGFHEKCIGPWVSRHKTCPLCRADATYDGPQRPNPLEGLFPDRPNRPNRPQRPPVLPPSYFDPPTSVRIDDEFSSEGFATSPRFVLPPVVNSRLVPIQTRSEETRNYQTGLSMYVT